MILLKILKLIKNTKKNTYIKKLKKIYFLLIFIKNTKKIQKIQNYIKNKQQQKITVTQNVKLITYILKIQFSPTNTLLNVTDITGKSLISLSAGNINLKKRQKKKQPLALINMLKSLLSTTKILNGQTISIHFKNVRPYYESIIIKLLKDKFFIKSIKSYNLHPHNGCRPRKLKKFKLRTKKLRKKI